MEKIKSVLHRDRKSEDVSRDSHDASASQQHPIYDEMTGHKDDTHDTHHGKHGKEGTLTAAGGPYAQVQTTSGEPYTTLAQPGTEGLRAEHVAKDPTLSGPTTTSGYVGDSKTIPGHHLGSSHHTTGDHVSSSTATHEPYSTSHTTTGGVLDSSKTSHEPHTSHTGTGGIIDSSKTSHEPHTSHTTTGHLGDSSTASGAALGTSTATAGGLLRPDASPTGKDSLNTGVSGASIKSGVIGFGPTETQGHAAYPTQHAPEQGLAKDQVVGGGDFRTGETAATKDSHPTSESQTLPHSSTTTNTPHTTGLLGTSTQQPVRQESYTTDTDRSFPLAGGVASKHTDDTTRHHTTAAEHVPTTRAEDAGVHEGHSRHDPTLLAGGIASKHKENTPTHHDTNTVEREHAANENEKDSHRSIPIVGGLLAKMTSKDKDKDKEHTSTHHTSTSEQQPATVQKESHLREVERSAPLVGGVAASKHSEPTHHHTSTVGHDPAAVERGTHFGDNERAAPFVGGVASKHAETTPTHHTSTLGHEPAPTGEQTYSSGHDPSAPLVGGALAGGALAGGALSKHSDSTPSHHHASTREPEYAAASHTADTDRSLPIGVPGVGTVGSRQSEPTTTQHQTTSSGVPTTDSHIAGTDRSVAPAGGLATTSPAHTTTQHHPSTSERETTTKESDTADSHRSIPIIGGLIAKMTSSKDKEKAPEHTPSEHHTATREREPSAKESDTAKTHHSTPVVGGLMSKFSSKDKEPEHASMQHHPITSEREPGTKDRDAVAHDGHGREALAGAAAAAAAAGTSKGLSHSDERDIKGHGLETRQGTDGNLSSATPHTTTTTTEPHAHTTTGPLGSTTTGKTGSTTHQAHPEALAAATAAAAAAASRSPTSHEPGHGTTTTGHTVGSKSAPVDESIPRRPAAQIRDSYRHVPGGFPSTPGDESKKTFLDYRPVVGDASTPSTSGLTSEATPGLASAGTTTGQHELRHTGSLEQPTSKSSDVPTEHHHHGRDAAIAGGVVAGAAGLGHAASEKRETTDSSSKPLYEESSPYSSKTLDPRVLGTGDALQEQRFDPHAKTAAHPQDALHTSNPVGISTTSGPTTSHSTTGPADSHHHDLGRDAALAGAGATTAGAARPLAPRNDTEGMGTFVLPPDTSNTAPVSSSTAPLAASTAPTSHHTTTGNDTFYGTAGAPAPRTETTSATTTSASHAPEKDSQHHYGRDATLAGAGLATAGGLAAASHDNKTETGPASKTIGPHDNNIANIVDPRVQPDPSKQKDQTEPVQHKSSILNKLDPRVKSTEKTSEKEDHHHGRDAAVAGGTGAAAYEAAKTYDQHRSTQPEPSMTEQRYDTTAAGAHAPNPLSTKGHHDPSTTGHHDPSTTSHHDRNTALGAGAGLGAATAGAAAYAGSKHGDNTHDLPLHQRQDITGQPGSVMQSGPTHGTIAPQNTYSQDPTGHQRYDSLIDPSKQHHDKRDAALAGTAGAATAGGAAYALSQHQEAEHERERLEKEQEKQMKKEAHEREKEQHKQEKEANKLQKEQHKHDKAVVATGHKHDKEVAAQEKEQHRLEKEQEKEQHRLEKEQHKREKEEEKEARRHSKVEEGEKKGGILGFLHRDKSKKEKASPEASPRSSKEYAAAGTAGALGAGTAAAAATHSDENDPNSSRWKAKNVLHKDPPPGHPAREALDHPNEGHGEAFTGKREHVGIDGPIGHPDMISGDRETRKGVFGAHEIGDAHSHTVIEPVTGLPMDVGKFGPGTGGTDGFPAIAGHHGLGTDTNTSTMGHHGLGPNTNTSTTGHHHVPGTTSGTTTGTGVGTGHTHTSTERDVI